MNCQYFGLLPTFGAVILCGALLWGAGSWAPRKIAPLTGRQGTLNENENPFKVSQPPGGVAFTAGRGS